MYSCNGKLSLQLMFKVPGCKYSNRTKVDKQWGNDATSRSPNPPGGIWSRLSCLEEDVHRRRWRGDCPEEDVR